MRQSLELSAIEFGQALITQVTGIDCGATHPLAHWSGWTSYLYSDLRSTFRAIDSIWSLVQLGERPPDPSYVLLYPISLENNSTGDWILNPVSQRPEFDLAARTLGEALREQQTGSPSNFDRFYFLMQKYASTLPCTYRERGISLFQQWRMVASVIALAQGETPDTLPPKLVLIGLDLPGIQETVYTITSRGAGKSVRGRSAFVQLLVNAITDRIVRELNLCRANVIVNAGGNALILAGWSDDLVARLEQLDRELNRLLLHGNDAAEFAGFQGDLAVALAWTELPWSALAFHNGTPNRILDENGHHIAEWQWHEKKLKDKLQKAKQRPFVSLLSNNEGFNHLFRPEPIDSNRSCAVCRRPEHKQSVEFVLWNEEDAELLGSTQVVCPLCKSFVSLARDIGKRGVYLIRTAQKPTGNPEAWQIGLHACSGYWYALTSQPQPTGLCLALSPNDFPATNVDGFWPLATSTPKVTPQDISDLQIQVTRQPRAGDIRDNALLANDTTSSFKRLGVLKADVDRLAEILFNGLGERRSAALTATLSESLTLFFGGWLDQICAEDFYRNKVYVLYAGGDDLLIIGTWDVMPQLAARIASDFARYTGENPDVHLSAGISMVGGKEPLHAAIEAADSALKQAKRYPFGSSQAKKNAITFIGNTFEWPDFVEVQQWQERLVALIATGAPKSLLMTLLQIYTQYQDDKRKSEERISGYSINAKHGDYGGASLYLGPWLWQMIYRLHRISNAAISADDIKDIQRTLLQSQSDKQPGGVEKMALSARWAQLASRKSD